MTDTEGVTIQDAIDRLNELLELDPNALSELSVKRVPANDKLAIDHPYVQCALMDGQMAVGMLGILNGIFGRPENGGWIAMSIDEETGEVLKFFKLAPENAKENKDAGAV